jgi:broad specificity phosphatase PhoE
MNDASAPRETGTLAWLAAGGDRGKAAQKSTRFWWVRHAPVAHDGRIYGQSDLSCDCSGTAAFAGLAAQLPRRAVWVASNLRRTHETAAAIIRARLPGPAAIAGPEILAVADLAEQNFGDWQGLTYEELNRMRNGAFHRFWHAPAHETPPGGESFGAVIERVSRAIRRLVEAYAGRDVIAVAHGGTIRAALATALDLDPEAALAFAIDNCSLTRIDHIGGPGMGHGWRVVTVNRPPG